MRTIEMTAYTAKELKEAHPAAFKRALDKWGESVDWDGYYADEIFSSLEGLFNAAGVVMKSFELNAYGPSWIRPVFSSDFDEQVGNFSGKRAMAWIENNLFGALRIPWTGKRRNDVRKYGAWYRPGLVPPCPFTGCCYDDDFLDALLKDVRNGVTLYRAFKNLASVYSRLLEGEIQSQKSEEYFLDHAESNGYEFDNEGDRI